MNSNIKRRKAITKMVLVTLLAFALLVVGAIIYSETGICWPAAVTTAFLFLEIFLWLLPYYHKVTAFVCPECNKVFKPTFTEMLFALHVVYSHTNHGRFCCIYLFLIEFARFEL